MEPWFGSVNLQLFDHSACGDLAGPCCSGIQEFLTTRFPFTPYVVENYRCWAWVEIAAMWTTIHWDCRPNASKMVEPHTQIKLWAMRSFVMFFLQCGPKGFGTGKQQNLCGHPDLYKGCVPGILEASTTFQHRHQWNQVTCWKTWWSSGLKHWPASGS